MSATTAPRRVGTIALSALLALAGSFALALSATAPASAHVTLDVSQAAPGSFALIRFKVPTESADATTTSVSVTLPSDTPFAYVSYVPVPGWTTELTRTTLPQPVKIGDGEITEAVTRVTWTAQPGSELPSGALQLFPLSLGPVPDVGSLAFPVDQGYSDGTVVSWSDTGEGAEHPAPVLFVNDPVVVEHDDDGDSAPIAEAPAAAEAGTASPDVLARVLGIAGLVLGAGGLAFGIASRRGSKAAA